MGQLRNIRWSEWLFIACFVVFAVGGSWMFRAESLLGALLTLGIGTGIAIVVWLGALWLVARAGRGTAHDAHQDPHQGDEGQ